MIIKSIEGLIKHEDMYVSPMMNIQTIVSNYTKPLKQLLADRLEQIKLSKVAQWETLDITIKPSDWRSGYYGDLPVYVYQLPKSSLNPSLFKIQTSFNIMHDDYSKLNKNIRFKYLFSEIKDNNSEQYVYCNIKPDEELTALVVTWGILDLEAVKEPDGNVIVPLQKDLFYKVADKMYKFEVVYDIAQYTYDVTCTFDPNNINKYIESECRYITAEYLNGKIIITSEKPLNIDVVLIFNRIKEVN